MSYKLLIMGGKAIFIFWTCSAAFLSLYFLSLSVSFDSFFCHVFTFNFAERIKQNVGRQGFYGKLFYDFCVPAGKITYLFPLQSICFDCFCQVSLFMSKETPKRANFLFFVLVCRFYGRRHCYPGSPYPKKPKSVSINIGL